LACSSLRIEDLHAGYGTVRVLDGVSLHVGGGEIAVLLGTNGNGKSTLMRCIMGLVRSDRGSIHAEIDGSTYKLTGRATEDIVDLGIVLVPEGRRLFPRLSVEENLVLGAFRPRARAARGANLDLCYALFPRLKEPRAQPVASMSGGEQQMVALARAIMSAPRILLIDEPSVGLAPIMVQHTIGSIGELQRRLGLTVLMAEQNFHQAIRIADLGYVLVHGRVAFAGLSREALSNNELIRDFYLGL
jgi:branched-chain amino acid transport system ATP-binding protein